MASENLFSEVLCKGVGDMFKYQDFNPMKTFTNSIANLSKVLVGIKSKNSEGTSSALNTALDKFDGAVNQFRDTGTNINKPKLNCNCN